MNRAAMSMSEKASAEWMVEFFRHMPWSSIAGSSGRFFVVVY